MNRWSQVIALGVLLGLLLATANYFYQADKYAKSSQTLGERMRLSYAIQDFQEQTGKWPTSIADLPPEQGRSGWTFTLISEEEGLARFKIRKDGHERQIGVKPRAKTRSKSK